MAAGFLAVGRCFASFGDALDAYYGAVPPAQTPGNPSYIGMFIKSSSGWLHITNQYGPSGYSTEVSRVGPLSMLFPSCDPSESFFDGLTLGWGVVAAMVVAWAVLQMKRQAK